MIELRFSSADFASSKSTSNTRIRNFTSPWFPESTPLAPSDTFIVTVDIPSFASGSTRPEIICVLLAFATAPVTETVLFAPNETPFGNPSTY